MSEPWAPHPHSSPKSGLNGALDTRLQKYKLKKSVAESLYEGFDSGRDARVR